MKPARWVLGAINVGVLHTTFSIHRDPNRYRSYLFSDESHNGKFVTTDVIFESVSERVNSPTVARQTPSSIAAPTELEMIPPCHVMRSRRPPARRGVPNEWCWLRLSSLFRSISLDHTTSNCTRRAPWWYHRSIPYQHTLTLFAFLQKANL